MVALAEHSPRDSAARIELARRFAVITLAVLKANGILNLRATLLQVLSNALSGLRDPDMFSVALWDALADIDQENARYQHDLTFFMIQFVHDTRLTEREILEKVLLRPPASDQPELYEPSNEDYVAAFGALLRVMVRIARRDVTKFRYRTKGFFTLSRVEKLQERHDNGQSTNC